MRRPAWTLFLDEDRLRTGRAEADSATVAELDARASDPPAAVARAFAGSLRAQGHHGEGVVLALSSPACLAAAVPLDGLPSRNRSRALAWRLEEKLPVEAESFVADFVEGGPCALGVAVIAAPLRGVVDGLEAEGIPVEAIVPEALLAVQGLPGTSGAVVWGSGETADVVLLEGGRPAAWRLVRAAPEAIERQLALSSAEAVPLRAIGLASEVAETLAAGHRRTVEALAVDRHASAARAARDGLQGTRPFWLDLRRDALGTAERWRRLRRPLAAARAAAAALLLVLVGGMQLRRAAYEAVSREHRAEVHRVFETCAPGQPAPSSVQRRLESTLRELRGLQGLGDAAPAGDPAPRSALSTLAACLARIPSDVRLCLLDLRFEPERLQLSGKTTSHGEAERLAAALAAGGRFGVEPPRTESLKEPGVSFTLAASVTEVAAAELAGDPRPGAALPDAAAPTRGTADRADGPTPPAAPAEGRSP